MKFEKNTKQINNERLYSHRRAPTNGYYRSLDEYPTKQKLNNYLESRDKNQLLKDLYQVKEDINKFKNELNGLAEQMDGMELHLNVSENRVHEIEKDITATQEVNVNLQVILERAVSRQKETDVYAIRAMKNIHTNLATVVYETGQLRGRISCIADYQRQQKGNVVDVAERIREYSFMLEDAIHSIQSRPKKRLSSLPEKTPSPLPEKRLKSGVDLYKHRIIRKHVSSEPWLPPQQGLKLLLSDSF